MTTSMIRERWVNVGNMDLYVSQAGDKSMPTLLLLHGIYDRWESWEPVIPALSRGYHVIALDLRGHARSSKPDSGYELEDYANDAVGVLDALDVNRAIVLGHSLGALVGLTLAAIFPDNVTVLVLEDPPLGLDEGSAEMMRHLLEAKRGTRDETYEFFREFHWYRGEDDWQRQTDWLRDTTDGPFEAMIDFAERGQGPELMSVCSRVIVPTLLLQADPEAGAALSDRDAETALSRFPNCRLAKFPETGHVIHRERPDEFVAAVTEFLNSNP